MRPGRHARAVRVLVTDAHSTSALAVVRSLCARGYAVSVATEPDRIPIASHSRYASTRLRLPSATAEPDHFADALASVLAKQRFELLVPTTDVSITVIARHRDRFEQLTRVALPPAPVLDVALDKQRTIAAAHAAGVAVPRTICPATATELAAVPADTSFPCVVKPRFSKYWGDGRRIVSARIRYASSQSSLLAAYRQIDAAVPRPLIQEWVSGEGKGVFVLAEHGEPLVTFAHRRIRESNPCGGPASLAESIKPDERLVGPALRLLRALRWHGPAMVEFKDPGGDAPPVLMEINGRLWGSLPLAMRCGVDFPLYLTQLFLGEQVQAPASYPVGVRCRHLRGDLSHLMAVFKGRPSEWPGAFPARLATLLALLPWPGRWTPYNFRLDDPVPALVQAWDFAASELRRTPHTSQPPAVVTYL